MASIFPIPDARFRPFALIAIFLVCLVSTAICRGQDDTNPCELTWKNGDKLPGKAVSGDSLRLKWQANLFRDPLDVDLTFLDRIKFNSDEGFEKSTETFAIQTVDGYSLYGDIKELDNETLTMTSPRFGDVQVKRSQVATILNLTNSGSLINGEFDLSQWDASRNEKKYWTVNDQGQLQSLRSNVHIYLKSELPESALIEVELEWEKKLDFIFGFGVPRNSRKIESLPRLEAWDEWIVFSFGDDFEQVLELTEGEQKRLKFLIHWNRKTNIVVIHDERGKTLATADLGKMPSNIDPGIYLENKSGDLKLASLMIRRSSAGFDATRPSIQTVEESAINGQVTSFDGDNWKVRTADGDEVEISKHNFCGAFLVNPPQDRPVGRTRLKFLDGMSVRGKFLALNGNKITLATDVADDPVTFDLAGAAVIRFDSSPNDATTEFSHRLYNNAGQIQGRLEPGTGAEDDILRWRVAGAETAVPFSQGDARIVLQEKTPIISVDEEWADTLYLTNRDTVPCRVVSMDEQQITVESFFQSNKIDQSLVKAVDLRNQAMDEQINPTDKDWVIPEKSAKTIKLTDKKLALSKGAEFGHPWLFATGGFEFELSWRNNFYGNLECRMLVGDVASGEGGKKINVMMYGDNIFVGNPGETNPNNGMINVKNGKTKLAFKYLDGKLIVTVDGRKAYSEKVDSTGNRGRGVQFKLNDMYSQGIKCDLGEFKLIHSDTSNSLVFDVNQKELLLTIPRMKKKNPPKQILCASNMDMVRGDLISFDQEHVMFRANNDVKRFPREIVASVVWLHADDLAKLDGADDGADESTQTSNTADVQPDTNTADGVAGEATEVVSTVDISARGETVEGQTVQVLMLGNRRMTTKLNSWTEDKLSGNSRALGACEIPFDQIYELRFGSFATKATDIPYSDWVATLAPEPKMETGADGQPVSESVFGGASPLIGTAQSFSIPMVNGKSFSLKSQLGKVVVLDFWATWCGPCVQALPKIEKTIAEYPSTDVTLLAINQEEDIEQVKSFLKARQLDIPVGLDSGKIGQQFQVSSLPQTVIIDQDGMVAFVKVGNSNDLEEKLKAAIDQLLADDEEAEK